MVTPIMLAEKKFRVPGSEFQVPGSGFQQKWNTDDTDEQAQRGYLRIMNQRKSAKSAGGKLHKKCPAVQNPHSTPFLLKPQWLRWRRLKAVELFLQLFFQNSSCESHV